MIMDNCGFHHKRHVEPALRNMLAQNGCTLLFQLPYNPVYNTCEYCFRVLNGLLRKNTELTENHTVVAIYDGLCRITLVMSRIFFQTLWMLTLNYSTEFDEFAYVKINGSTDSSTCFSLSYRVIYLNHGAVQLFQPVIKIMYCRCLSGRCKLQNKRST